MDQPAPTPVRISASRIVHDDPLALVERLDLSAPISVRSETIDGFQLNKRQRSQDTTLATKTRISSLSTSALFLVHTRTYTYLCAEDVGIKGRMVTLLQLTPQQSTQDSETLLRYVEMVRSIDLTDQDLASPSRANMRQDADGDGEELSEGEDAAGTGPHDNAPAPAQTPPAPPAPPQEPAAPDHKAATDAHEQAPPANNPPTTEKNGLVALTPDELDPPRRGAQPTEEAPF